MRAQLTLNWPAGTFTGACTVSSTSTSTSLALGTCQPQHHQLTNSSPITGSEEHSLGAPTPQKLQLCLLSHTPVTVQQPTLQGLCPSQSNARKAPNRDQSRAKSGTSSLEARQGQVTLLLFGQILPGPRLRVALSPGKA